MEAAWTRGVLLLKPQWSRFSGDLCFRAQLWPTHPYLGATGRFGHAPCGGAIDPVPEPAFERRWGAAADYCSTRDALPGASSQQNSGASDRLDFRAFLRGLESHGEAWCLSARVHRHCGFPGCRGQPLTIHAGYVARGRGGTGAGNRSNGSVGPFSGHPLHRGHPMWLHPLRRSWVLAREYLSRNGVGFHLGRLGRTEVTSSSGFQQIRQQPGSSLHSPLASPKET